MSSYNIYGGTPKKTLDLLKYFKEKSVFYAYSDAYSEYKPLFQQTNAHIYEGDYKRNIFLHIYKLLKIIDNEGIDIIQTQFSMGEVLGGILKKFRPHIKLVITFESSLPPSTLKKNVVSNIYKFADAFIYISNYVKKEKIQQFPLLANKFGKVIYNGTERREAIEERTFNVFHPALVDLSSLIDIKNISILIKAIKIIREKMDKEVFLYVAGDGSERSKLEDMIYRNNLNEYIHLLGQQKDVGQLINECDIFVHPCHVEGFGIAIAEAMMAGKPTIVANTGASPELIENRKSGLTVDPFDANAWADAIIQLLENKIFSQQLGQQAKRRACEMFSIKQYTTNYEAFYQELLEEQR